MDIATVVFSHVRCVETRLNLVQVSTLWRDASKTAAAYPLEFDVDAFPESWHDHVGENVLCTPRTHPIIGLLDNDEALSLPYERVVGLLGEAAKNVCDDAADRGSVRLLKWARENNLDWGEATCSDAVLNGHLPALQYLHENGCPWDKWTCSRAAMNGHLPVLQYLHENGCPWDSDTCYWAASNGHLPVLQYLYENGCPLNSHACLQAAGNGHLSVLKYLYENGCPWHSHACLLAAGNGDLSVLQYLYENGCPWEPFFTWQHVAFHKHWDCLQCMVDIKCPGWKYYAKKYAEHLTDELLL